MHLPTSAAAPPLSTPSNGRGRALSIIIVFALCAAAHGQQILEFSSAHCQPCQHARPRVEELQASGFPITSHDVEQEPQLAKRYRITAIPAFVAVDAAGKETGRYVGEQYVTSRMYVAPIVQPVTGQWLIVPRPTWVGNFLFGPIWAFQPTQPTQQPAK